jgi:adenine-specific DNA-methyltransferase
VKLAKKSAMSHTSQLLAIPVDNFSFVPKLSFGTSGTGNAIIQADNLAALKSLAEFAESRIRCVYIDPPYNNQEKYTHYDDATDHDAWLRGITARLEYFYRLLTDDGTLWISIDDRGLHYLKVAADSILGRHNFVTTIVWQQRTTRENRRTFSNNHEYILVYAKQPALFKKKRNLLPYSAEAKRRYKNPDNDPRGPWQSVSANVQAGHGTRGQFYVLESPNGRRHAPPNGRCWIFNSPRMREYIRNNDIWFGRSGNGVPRLKKFLRDSIGGLNPETFWPASEVGTTKSAKKHWLQMFPDEPVFDTPKPEHLIRRILQIATNPGEWVLDGYLGSGTTAAVAHKMGRRYIGIEQGEHAVTCCAQRLRCVIRGEAGGISEVVSWTGGGGFDFYRIAEPQLPKVALKQLA